MKKITIIIPVYNIEKYLSETLDSILAQTYTEWSCIIVNDGSTDNSQKIIDEYCERDSRFRSLVKENEKSADLARKYALKYVDTEFVIYIDGDDVIETCYVEKLIERQIETDADIVMARLIGCENDIKGVSYMIPVVNFDMTQILRGKQVCIDNFGGWTSSLTGALFKKHLISNVNFGPYMNSDEFSQRQIEYNADKVAFCDVKYLYRNNIGTSLKISVRMFDRTLVDIQLEDFINKYFSDRIDKKKKLAWQRLFNLVYLTADYNINRIQFTEEEQCKIIKILKYSFKLLNIKLLLRVAPLQTLMAMFNYDIFSYLSTLYVKYKRSHGGNFYYR